MQPLMNADQRRFKEDDYPHQDLSFLVNGCAMSVLNEIGHGFNEKIYENAMACALQAKDILFTQQKQYNVHFQGHIVGTFIPDFVIEDKIIVEMKTVDRITDIEKGQVMNYLRVSGLSLAIIFNFKNPKLDWQRVVLS
jgi:GxxExxY protein